MDHSGSPELQANSDENPHGRRIGDGGEFGPQMGADRGRWWQMGDFSQNSAPRRSRRLPPAPRNHRENQPQTVAHFAKPARKPRRKRAESPKTIPKTVRKTRSEEHTSELQS